MIGEEFITKWRNRCDPDGTPMVGIVVNWDKIQANSKVIQFLGKEAWEKILDYAPPWHIDGVVKPFKQWIGDSAYLEEIEREKQAGKLHHYERNGLEYPYFCIFALEDCSKGVVGDGNHRFLNCRYLESEGKDLSKDISRCTVDILCVNNLSEIIQDAIFLNY